MNNEKLIKKAKMRDADAFTELVQSYMQDMYRVALAILKNDDDVGDAIQETILTCWEKLDTLRNPKFFKTWLTKILMNKCNDIIRQKQNLVGLEEWQEPASYEEEDNADLKEMLDTLGDRYRLIMILYYTEGYSTEEIAKMLKLSKSTVQTRLQRGREKLFAIYGKESDEKKGWSIV